MRRGELLRELEQGTLPGRLVPVYGRDAPSAAYRLRELVLAYGEAFPCGDEAETLLFSTPGRTELGGNHTDHQHGHGLAASVDLDTIACVVPNDSRTIRIKSRHHRMAVVDLGDLSLREEEAGNSVSLVRGVAARLAQLGYRAEGFDAYTTTRVLRGSGLSSSAAFEVLTATIMNQLFCGGALTATDLAKVGQYAENVYFGKPSGLMDQMASSVGGLVTIDFLPDDPDVRAIQYDFQKKGYAVCVVTVGGDHGDLTGEYAAITTEMRAVSKALGIRALAETDAEKLTAALPKLKNHVPDRGLLRAFHFVDETARVTDAVAALERDDVQAFFEALVASGESSWKLLQNLYVPGSDNQEMPLALEMSRRMLAGRGAWRIHGGGFAGTILAFVPMDMLDAYRAQMDAVFGAGATVALSIRPEGAVVLQ